MEVVSEEENKNNDTNTVEGQSKPKRQMKTPYQLETLEKAYALETYPSESKRAELSEKLGLSDRQLQMWFCHKRLKDKKGAMAKKPRSVAAAIPDSPRDEMAVADSGSEHGSGSGSGLGLGLFDYRERRKVVTRYGAAGLMVGDDVAMMQRCYESPEPIMELRAIAAVEAQLGEPLREDGPILGMEFDLLPPDAFGAPIAMAGQQKQSGRPYEGKIFERSDARSSKAALRALHEYQILPGHSSIRSDAYGRVAPVQFRDFPVDGPSANTSSGHANKPLSRGYSVQGHLMGIHPLSQQDKQGHIFSSPPGDYDRVPQRELTQRDSCMNVGMDIQFSGHPMLGPQDPHVSSDMQISHNEDVLQMARKRKNEEAKIAREVEAHEKQIQKEVEKQDILRRKREEQMRKEMGKNDRERRKEEERLMREKRREEDKYQREQRREIERREKFLQKESLRAEKMRQKEELHREKEAVRLKAAIEKATARKIARESMELIEDERLELMELAASSKGLNSIISLNHDTLQNLESFRDSLSAFPPKSVQLKRPFAIQPWINSEANIGNLLMVWRFLITFADVLELWPFTLDEFVQAFHDYDSRLLGEMHVALLKLIIKDIEDVSRTPSIGLGTNQNSAANPEGGHPQIVEGAYAWGFDISNWQRNLNPLTWPEILRQFALSAGFGPQLKKRSIEWASLDDNNEGKGSEDIVSTLRNGSAAENAVAMMQEKGFSLLRRSRHRLTPGTVKFAAFHVLSLEGSKGLTVLELADKIQKSGLRDLTTSKTPEASITAALSRDAHLFERIAPSRYCVRPAFRKDPADAEAILSAAREKLQIFENGFLAVEVADDVERDEDSECDVAEGPEVDELGTPSNTNKCANHCNEASPCSENGKENVVLNLQNDLEKDFSSFLSSGFKDANCPGTSIDQYVAGIDIGVRNPDQESTEIDESKSGELWVQGLTEGEYSDLSVEERLNALVALIGFANEGNSIRAVLEVRMEAANALKKQMWAEAQLDKRRLKEENIAKLNYPSFMGSKAETEVTSSAAEGSQSPLPVVDNKDNEASLSTAVNQKPFIGSHNVQNHFNTLLTAKTLVVQDFSMGPDNFSSHQQKYAAERSRLQLKSYIAHRAEEMYVYRSLPLGQDRRHNRYWQFVASASRNDPGSGRVFIESPDGYWRLIDSEEAFDALLMSLDARGIREFYLYSMLKKIEMSFKENVRRKLQCANMVGQNGTIFENGAAELDSSPDCTANFDSPSSTVCGLNSDTSEPLSSFRIELGRNEAEKAAALKRYQDFQKWMWKECFNSLTLCAMKFGKKRCGLLMGICDLSLNSHFSGDNHCHSCLGTFGTFDNNLYFSEHAIQCEEKREVDHGNFHNLHSCLPLGIKLLKALLALIEVCIPLEALQSFWTEDHRKTWGMKLHTSSSIEDLLKILTLLEGAIKRDRLSSQFETTKELLGSNTLSGSAVYDFSPPESVPELPWIPQTTAAVALRLLELDASILYTQHQKAVPHEDKEVREFIKLPTRYSLLKNIREFELTEHVNLGSGPNSSKCGRGRRGRGRDRTNDERWQNARDYENSNKKRGQQGRRTHGQVCGRGRRTVRRRRTEKNAVKETLLGHFGDTVGPNSRGELPRYLGAEEWAGDEIRMKQAEGADDSDNAEAVESDDNAQAMGYEHGNRGMGYLMEVSDEDLDGSKDDNGNEVVGEEDSDGNVDMNEGSDGVINRVGNDDEGTDSAVSDDYSE